MSIARARSRLISLRHLLRAGLVALMIITCGGGVQAVVSPGITEFPIPTGQYKSPSSITSGPDGNIWFTMSGSTNAIGRLEILTGVITEFPIAGTPGLFSITSGPDGNLWFTESTLNRIGKMSVSGVIITEYPLPAGSSPRGICWGPDGNLWFCEFGTNMIGIMTTAGVLSEIPIPNSAPHMIAVGPDNNLWFTQSSSKKITRIDSVTRAVTTFPPVAAGTLSWITAGPDNKLWFIENTPSTFGRMDLAGTLAETAAPAPALGQIAKGPDGTLWATQTSSQGILSISTTGVITPKTISYNGSGITTGPDNNVWFTEYSAGFGSAIGRVNFPHTRTTVTADRTGLIPGQSITLTAVVSAVAPATGIPAGTMTLRDGVSTLATTTLDAAGVGSFTIGSLASGPHNLTVSYDGSVPLVASSAVVRVLVSAPVSLPAIGVPRSRGVDTHYYPVCGATPQGVERILSFVRSHTRHEVRAFAWDALTQSYTELPDELPTAGLREDTGIFLATREAWALDPSGVPNVSPYDLTLRPGWNFIGIPALMDGASLVTAHPLSEFTLFDQANVPVTAGNRLVAMSAAYRWNGTSYESAAQFELGVGYWIENTSSPAQTLTLRRVNTLTGGVPVLSVRETTSGIASTPPAPPSAASPPKPKGCGSGGVGLVLALSGLVLARRRVLAWGRRA